MWLLTHNPRAGVLFSVPSPFHTTKPSAYSSDHPSVGEAEVGMWERPVLRRWQRGSASLSTNKSKATMCRSHVDQEVGPTQPASGEVVCQEAVGMCASSRDTE